MRIELPVHIDIQFRIKPEHLYDTNLTDEISQQLFRLLDEFYPKYLKQLLTVARMYGTTEHSMFGKITESVVDNLRFDLVNMKAEINIPHDGSPCRLSTNMKIIYEDSNPLNNELERQLIQATLFTLNSLRWNHIWGTIVKPFSEAYNPIFLDGSSYTFSFTLPEVINIQGRTRRRAIQGIQALPQNVTNIVANYAVGPSRNGPERQRPIPEALTNETLRLPFEVRLARAEEARAARNLEVARQASAAAAAAAPAPETKKPWWKRMFGKGRRASTHRRKPHTRKTRGRRRA